MQTISKSGLLEIAFHEGIVLSPYKDISGVWTIGIGHTARAGEPDPERLKGKELSLPEVMAIFARDIKKFEIRVNKAFKRKLTQHQFDAAISFDFNTGAIFRATWVKLFNEGRISEARKVFMNWSKPKAIIPRRQKERDLFFQGTYSFNGYLIVYPADRDGRVLWRRGKRVRIIREKINEELFQKT